MTSKLASLHAGLVARKGEATPAVSHPLFSYVDTPRPAQQQAESGFAERRSWPQHAERIETEEEHADAQFKRVHQNEPVSKPARLGLAQQHEPAPVPEQPKAVSQPETPPASHEADHSTDAADDPHAARYRFTFRLTPAQRHRLRLAAALRDQSLQQVLSTALDNHLEGLCACSLKECACLAKLDAGQT